MNYLLFFITSIFSFIIFIFYKLSNGEKIFTNNSTGVVYFSNLTGNLFIDSILFFILALFLFFYFSNIRFLKKEKNKIYLEENNIEEQNYNSPIIPFQKGDEPNYIKQKKNILNNINIKKFFANYIYYIGFILFYISIYLILYSFGITDFSYLILFLNFIIFVFFFLSHKANLFKDFIKINTILFSLYYIILYLYIFISSQNSLNNFDLINTLFIFSFFIITFYGDYKKGKVEQNIINTDNSLVLYFFIYSFIVLSFYLRIIFVDYLHFISINFSLIFVYISAFLNILIYFILQRIIFFQKSIYILRALSLLFGYISIIFSIVFFIKNINNNLLDTFWGIFNTFSIIGILLYLIIFNFRIHKKYQNYISLFFSLSGLIFLFNFILYKNINLFGGNIFNLSLILNFTISYFIVIFTYLYRQKYNFDYFFLHICAYIINILGISYYLFFGNFEILNLGIILLLDSILIFLSYFKLKKVGRGE